ncbi:uncharacterized protein LOC100908460 [Galendromus occidentalis]|uniref:Uncharacterized protein LOC100908460 n=1 Tax=Galendromus occidentalis TaxID=34638 RepID=A0AAJ6QV24_9ACAR|nr:uncharacterized protein LOC100908460 [Galendromus occidentalis]
MEGDDAHEDAADRWDDKEEEIDEPQQNGELETTVEHPNLNASDEVYSSVRISLVFSPMLFMGEDLYQRKRVRAMIYRYDDASFSLIDIEDLTLDTIVLVVDDDGVDFQRGLVSEITHNGVSVDLLDYFGVKAVPAVYECPEEIQAERPALRKYSLKSPPRTEPIMRGRRVKLICDFSDKDYVEADIVE